MTPRDRRQGRHSSVSHNTLPRLHRQDVQTSGNHSSSSSNNSDSKMHEFGSVFVVGGHQLGDNF